MPKPLVVILPTHRLFLEAVQSALSDYFVCMAFGGNGDIQIIFDDSQGYLLQQIETLEPHPKRIYFSHNPCPEYLEYLKTFGAKVVVFNPSVSQIVQAVKAVENNSTLYLIPESKANLTTQEKTIIRLIAEGKSQRQIATLLGKSYGTIRNQITREIKPKLKMAYPDYEFKTDQHLARYYNGGMHLLRIWYLEARQTTSALELQETRQRYKEQRLQDLMKEFCFESDQRKEAIAYFAENNIYW